MKKSKLTPREIVMIVVLVVLLTAVIYYMGFYTPLQEELARIEKETAQVETEIAASAEDIKKMDAMQAELDEIFARPADEITEVAPYDNKEAVLNQLNAILGQSLEYALEFEDPAVEEAGTVRRVINMTFRCGSYKAAKSIIEDLTDSPWRCLVGNLAIEEEYEMGIQNGTVAVSATITYFEHTGLK